MLLRKNDMVKIITGKDRGKTGKILEVFRSAGRVRVEKLNLVKRHQRPTQAIRQGGIVEKEAPLHVSNVMLSCPRCHKPARVGVKTAVDGRKTRVCKKCGESIDQ